MGKKNKDSDYEPGLGCPHCKWRGSQLDARATHIQEAHPGEDAGIPDDVRFVMQRAGMSTAPTIFRDKRK